MKINEITQKIKPSGIREFFDIVAARPDALSLGVGEPDFPTPWAIRNEAIKSIQKGYTAYTSNKGMLPLREEIATYMRDRFGLDYDVDSEIIVTVGASEGIDLALRVLITAGDCVLIPAPSYVSYEPITMLAGGQPVPIACSAENGFKLTAGALEEAILSAPKRPKVLILPYPNNPTGGVMCGDDLKAIAKIIEKYDLEVVSDEIYAELTYEGKHVSIASIDGMRERTIVLNGFSKAFSMTGWRMGWVCAPKDASAGMLKIHQYTALCAPTPSQYAGLAALKDGRMNGYESVLEMKEEYNRRRRFIVDGLNKAGMDCFVPGGAFYVFPSVEKLGLDGQKFARGLLAAENVAVVPGDAFGTSGKYHVRVSYAASLRTLTEAIKRINRFISSLN